MTEQAATLRIVVADDQRLVRGGFALMLSVEDDIEVVGEAPDGVCAIELCRELAPDLVLMDVEMPRMDGIEATRRIVADGLSRVVLLTTFDHDDYLFAGLDAGASGFLLKNTDPDDLVGAIRAAGHGHALLAPEVTRRVIERMTSATATGRPYPQQNALANLTPREREVLTLLGRGRSNAEIADHLVVGAATVKTHVSSCLAKLHLRDRVQAVVFAYEAGLIHPGD
ncbi:response regulator [Leekyejoonella antrihumi]|uniref:Response regulator transcription factor n=1 Tax=Leekyejoonella antrihumi TaxID=1660198 RepID=A0A563E6M3_9MICO|nr:response regulator transcription factor [Leekyejoonella antrihumi]TWP38166.1 response regulator transcription factor [Leekyejoonella antrihumi]